MRKNVLMMFAVCFMAVSQLFAAVPTLISFTPASAKANVDITITGTNFDASTTVKFGGFASTAVTFVNSTTIKAKAPLDAASGIITVENTTGGPANSAAIFYLQPTTASTLSEGDAVINKVFNSTKADGEDDAIEILIVKDHTDLRSLYIKDFQDGKNGGTIAISFKEIAFWSDMRAGTIIVIPNNATSSDVTVSPASNDFNLNIGLLNKNYMSVANANTKIYDINADNMISLQLSASSTNSPISILGGGAQTGLSFGAAVSYRLNNVAEAGPGTFTYVRNVNSLQTDFAHAGKAAMPQTTTYIQADNTDKTRSNVTMNDDSSPAALALGQPNNATNATFINGLRATVLPVNLISFTAKATTNGVAINWATASEQNNNRFEIQRSADGNSFVTIKTVTGANSANSRNNYSFTDKNSLTGVNYYKLVQIDNDGTVKELGVQAVSSDASGLNFSVASNNVANQVNYTVTATAAGNATIKIFNTSGAQIASSNVVLVAGNNSLKLSVSSLTSGVYVAVLTAENQTLTSKFVK